MIFTVSIPSLVGWLLDAVGRRRGAAGRCPLGLTVAGGPGLRSLCPRSFRARRPTPPFRPCSSSTTRAAVHCVVRLPVAGGSLAAEFWPSRPPRLSDRCPRLRPIQAAAAHDEPAAPRRAAGPRASEVIEDIGAAVDWIRQRTRAPKVALLGWGARRPRGGAVRGASAGRGGRRRLLQHALRRRSRGIRWSARDSSWPTRRGGRERINRATVGAYRLYDAAAISEARLGFQSTRGRRQGGLGAIRRWPRRS